MLITRKSQLSGIVRSKEIPVTPDQQERYLNGRENIQHIFPNLSHDDREFILTGITGEEWDEAFPDEDDDIEEEPGLLHFTGSDPD